MNNNLKSVLNPSSVAVIGASRNADKIGGRPIDYLKRFGFKGKIFPINPSYPEVQGMQSFPDIPSLPEVPEVVIVALPGEAAVAAVEQCASMGTKAAIVMSSGFGEGASVEGIDRATRMLGHASQHGMRII